MRLIALNRAVHAVGFAILAVGLVFLDMRVGRVHHWAQSLVGPLSTSGHSTLAHYVDKLVHLKSSTISTLVISASLYAVVEGVEAVGLWRERRWAEYLTVVATVGFMPFEIVALTEKVTVLRVGALITNVAILIYLVVSKRLFGLPKKHLTGTHWVAVEADPLSTTHARIEG